MTTVHYEDKLLLIQLREVRLSDDKNLREKAAKRLEKAFSEIAKLQAILEKQLY
jgi:hypothetical protein